MGLERIVLTEDQRKYMKGTVDKIKSLRILAEEVGLGMRTASDELWLKIKKLFPDLDIKNHKPTMNWQDEKEWEILYVIPDKEEIKQ